MKDSGYRILYKSSVERDLNKIGVSIRKRIVEKIEALLAHNPHKGKQLKGKYKGFWSARIGDYRVVYKISQKDVVVVVVKHRKEAYK